MNAFRYQAIEAPARLSTALIRSRRPARPRCKLLGQRGLFPSNLEGRRRGGTGSPNRKQNQKQSIAISFWHGGHRKEITAFTQEMARCCSGNSHFRRH